VIASSVTAKLEKDFVGILSKGRQRAGHFLPTLQLIMRQHMIQHDSITAVGVRPAFAACRLCHCTDATSFDLSEFTLADETAVIGETTTNATVGNLRKNA